MSLYTFGGWIKSISDSSKIRGSDEDVRRKKASWSAGPTFLEKCEVWHLGRKQLSISGLGNYHYSEDYEIDILNSNPKLLVRRLQFQINQHSYVVGWNKSNTLDIYPTYDLLYDLPKDQNYDILLSLHDYAQKWLTISYDLKFNESTLSIEDTKI